MTVSLLKSVRPLIMGILNVTPDSFSDGGSFLNDEAAMAHALRMVEEGADIVDVGGESTRPGSQRVSAVEQYRRVVNLIRRLRGSLPPHVAISVDTTQSSVAEAAVQAGAGIINDISAGSDDPAMFSLVAKRRVPLILMHMQGTPDTMQIAPHYENVVTECTAFLEERVSLALAAGISREQLAIDPGIGFGKSREHNLELLAGLRSLVDLGLPVVLGTSRKRFMGSLCLESDPRELIAATCATTALGVTAGVGCFRVHDVKANRQAADVAWAIATAGGLLRRQA